MNFPLRTCSGHATKRHREKSYLTKCLHAFCHMDPVNCAHFQQVKNVNV